LDYAFTAKGIKNIRYRQNDFNDNGGMYDFLLRYRQNKTVINVGFASEDYDLSHLHLYHKMFCYLCFLQMLVFIFSRTSKPEFGINNFIMR